MDALVHQFQELTDNLDTFVNAVRKQKSHTMATDKWTVKEVLCHLVFWHENYAANYHALAEHRVPPLLKGSGTELNLDGVASLRHFSTNTLITRLYHANELLKTSIVHNHVPRMTYKIGGRVYESVEFLHLIARHVATHTRQVRRART